MMARLFTFLKHIMCVCNGSEEAWVRWLNHGSITLRIFVMLVGKRDCRSGDDVAVRPWRGGVVLLTL